MNGTCVPCPRLIALVDEYDARVSKYSRCVAELRSHVGSPLSEEVLTLYEVVSQAKADCEEAREAFERHRAEHDCWPAKSDVKKLSPTGINGAK